MSTNEIFKVSFSQLVKYWNAENAIQRRGVIRTIFNPFGGNYYGEFNQAMKSYISGQQTDFSILERGLNQIDEARASATDPKEVKRLDSNHAILSNFMSIAPISFLEGVRFLELPAVLPRIEYGAISISVKPDILYTYQYRNRTYLGVIRFFITNDNLSEAIARFLVVILKEFTQMNFSNYGELRSRDCRLIDLNTGEIYSAPDRTTRLRTRIIADCNEIESLCRRFHE